jgi:hypothetical protein
MRTKRRWTRVAAIIAGLILGYWAAGYAQRYLPGTAANAARTIEAGDESDQTSVGPVGPGNRAKSP